ncbi:RNase H family protein [Lachnospiraceae bacterium HCP1S3_A10]
MNVDIYIKTRLRGSYSDGGYGAAVLEYVTKEGETVTRMYSETFKNITNHGFELVMCNKALQRLIKPCTVTVHTNDSYIRSAMRNKWPEKWRDNGWKKATGKTAANIQEWKQLLMLCEIHKVSWEGYDIKYDTELKHALETERSNDE